MRNRYEGIRRFFVVVGWLYFIFMAFMLLHPRPPVDYVPQYMFSVAHFLAFAALGALVGFARRKTTSYYWFGILFVWCSGSEYLQRYTGRFFEMRDIIQNTLGVGFGLPLAWLPSLRMPCLHCVVFGACQWMRVLSGLSIAVLVLNVV